MTLINRIDELCREKGISRRQLEREAGIGNGATSKWKNGYTPNNQSLQKLSEYFGVTVSYLIGESEYRTEGEAVIRGWNNIYDTEALEDEANKYSKGCLIPVLGDVPAGIPIEAVEDILDWEEISVRMSKRGKFFGLRIKGDSMSPRILEGDVVIVRQQPDAETGDIIVARVNGDEACCKKLVKKDDGIILQSFNPAYNPMYFSNLDKSSIPIEIIGKVVELRGKYY